MHFLFVLISALFLCSCDNFFESYEKHPKSPCEIAVNRVMARNAKELGQKYKMRPCAVTVGMPEGDIKYLALKFQAIGPEQKAEIRQILLSMCHDFLTDINADEPLLECLRGRKMNIEKIGITIFFHDKKRYPINEPNIGIAGLTKGNLKYVKVDKETGEFKDRQYETYEEALKLANENGRN